MFNKGMVFEHVEGLSGLLTTVRFPANKII